MSTERNDIDSRHPLLTDLSMDEILLAAERWQALTSRELEFPFLAPQGFTEAEQVKTPNRRVLSLTMNLVEPGKIDNREPERQAHQDAVYKLTEMADVVRARVVEERSA